MTVNVIQSGMFTTIQDMGRTGYQRFGMPPSGAMDRFALAAANILLGNEANRPALEFSMTTLEIEMLDDTLIAVTGYGVKVFIDDREYPAWMTIFVRQGSRVRLEPGNLGVWAYLAVAGAFNLEPALGSNSTYLRGAVGGVEGRTLRKGDRLPIGEPAVDLTTAAGRMLPENKRPSYSKSPTLRVILGPQLESFTPKGIQQFLSNDYQVTDQSDRMGYRLVGAPIEHAGSSDIISDGVVTGSIQVPSSRQPIIMMADHQTTGGYPKIATVIQADLPLLAQCRAGAKVRFCQVEPNTALVIYRAQMDALIEKNWSQHETFINHMRA
ncbi:MAG: biotin-dependent carboxyltransferase family protein [Anaerolineaceae bacterium]|nr:biotin-dependent carboxyltransferase family protein [Anaerolineaceae bacterium]